MYQWPAGAVAGRKDMRIRRASVPVDQDPVGAGNTRVLREFLVRKDSDAGKHDIGGQARTIGKHRCSYVAVGALKMRQLRAGQDGYALTAVFLGVEGAQHIAGDPREDARRHLQHGHFKAHLPGDGSGFEPDVSGADNHEALSGKHAGAQAFDISEGSQIVNARKISALHGQRARARAGGEDQVVVGKMAAMAELNLALGPVDFGDVCAQQELDLLVLVPGGGFEIEAFLVELAFHVGFRQRRALIRQCGFVAHDGQASVKTALAQGLNGLRGGLSGADHDDLPVPSQRHAGSPLIFVTAASLLCLMGSARRRNCA